MRKMNKNRKRFFVSVLAIFIAFLMVLSVIAPIFMV